MTIIVFILEINNLIAPIAIYFKGDKKDISKNEILHHIKMIRIEIEKEEK